MRNLSNSNSSSNNNRSRSCTRPLIDPRYGLYPSSADVKMEIYLAHAHTRGRQTRRKKRMRNPQLASIIRHWQIVGRKCRAAVWLLVASTDVPRPVKRRRPRWQGRLLGSMDRIQSSVKRIEPPFIRSGWTAIASG